MSTPPHPFLDNYKVEEEDEAYYEQSDSYFIDLHDSFLRYNPRLLVTSTTSGWHSIGISIQI